MPQSRSIIVLQSICTSWTKASRGGGELSTARNRTPEALTIPACTDTEAGEHLLLLHECGYGEHSRFQQPFEKWSVRELETPYRYKCLKLSLVDDSAEATLEWERLYGVPRRMDYLRTTFSFERKQWIRIMYNLRITLDYGWCYEKRVLNIAFLGYDVLSQQKNIFLHTVPAHSFVDIAPLR